MSNNLEVVFSRLISKIEQIGRAVSQLSVRNNNLIREGVVKSVDFEKGIATVEAHGIISKESAWMQHAGAISKWTPLSEGQRVLLFSPSGDVGKSVILPGGYTDDNKAPHNKGAEEVTKIGGCTLRQSEDGFYITVGGVTFEFTASGLKQAGGDQVHTGGEQTHNGLNVGSDHVHGGILPGGSDTTGPH